MLAQMKILGYRKVGGKTMGAYAALPTPAVVTRTVFGNKRICTTTITMDGSSTWPADTNGLSLTPAMFGMSVLEQIMIDPGLSGVVFGYDYVNQKLHAYVQGTAGANTIMVEAQASTPASSVVRITAIGYGLG